jgi:hypothetical protein
MCIDDWTWTFSRIKTRTQHKAYAISVYTCQEDNDDKNEGEQDYLILNDIFQYSSNPCQSLNLLFHFAHMSQMCHIFIIL